MSPSLEKTRGMLIRASSSQFVIDLPVHYMSYVLYRKLDFKSLLKFNDCLKIILLLLKV